MENAKVIFLFFLMPGGATTNIKLLQQKVLPQLSRLKIPFETYVYFDTEPEMNLINSFSEMNFISHKSLINTLKADLNKDDKYQFYFQDPRLINPVSEHFTKSKLILELHILQNLIAKYFLPTLSDDIDRINTVRSTIIPEAEKKHLLLTIDKAKDEELELLNKVDVIISNSQNTTSFLTQNFKGKRIIDSQIVNELVGDYKRESLVNNKTFLFLNPPTIFKGFHKLLNHSFQQDIEVVGVSEKLSKNFSYEDLGKFGIRFHRFISDPKELEQLLLSFQYALFPSSYESRGLSLDECLRAGIICIAQHDNPGFQDQIRHGHNGFLIDFNLNTWPEEIFRIFNSYNSSDLLRVSQNASSQSRLTNQERIGFILSILSEK